jgi:hypothetical protein
MFSEASFNSGDVEMRSNGEIADGLTGDWWSGNPAFCGDPTNNGHGRDEQNDINGDDKANMIPTLAVSS